MFAGDQYQNPSQLRGNGLITAVGKELNVTKCTSVGPDLTGTRADLSPQGLHVLCYLHRSEEIPVDSVMLALE